MPLAECPEARGHCPGQGQGALEDRSWQPRSQLVARALEEPSQAARTSLPFREGGCSGVGS